MQNGKQERGYGTLSPGSICAVHTYFGAVAASVASQFRAGYILDGRIQIARFCDRTLKQKAHHVVLALSHQLDHFGGQKIAIFLQKIFRLVNHASSKMMYCKANCIRFRSNIKFRFYIIVTFFYSKQKEKEREKTRD